MHQATIHKAKMRLTRMIREAHSAGEANIAEGNTAFVRTQPIPVSPRERRIGGAAGIVRSMAEDFADPLEDFAEYLN